ncbi:MAG: class I SAM-dependent methyltransferase [Dehalococcoidia bacterium]
MKAPPSRKGHRWFAAMYDWCGGFNERRVFHKIRSRIVGEVKGRVLEIGVGTGANFPYYAAGAQIVATEPDPYMLERARRRLQKLGLPNVELHQAPAEEIPFGDASFDHVLSSLVLCTVRDLPRALAEARRVLRPEGTFRFMEHVRNDDSLLWGKAQDLITPAWRWFGAGCHLNRRTRQAIEEAGFRIEWLEQVRIAPGTPAIYGVARPG